MEMNAERWARTCAYLHEVFGRQDEHLESLMPRAIAAGLPDIAVSAEVGRLLSVLVGLAGAARALEVGTLAGYSGIWIARALAPGGRLVTVEAEPRHAAFARGEFARAGVSDRVEVREGAALDVLPRVAAEAGEGGLDFVFLDAAKQEYERYLEILRPLIRRGGLLVADNALGSSVWSIGDVEGSDPNRDAMDRFNRRVAQDPAFEAACVPIRQGVLIARRV